MRRGWYRMSLHVTLQELHPESIYQGTVYEQRAVLESPDGVVFGGFDPDLVLDEALVGEEVVMAVSLLATRGGVRPSTGEIPKIMPNSDDPTGWANHTFIGRVAEVVDYDEYFYQIWLDVGCGKIWFLLEKEGYDRPRVGAMLEVAAGRTDIDGVVEVE